MEMQAIKFIVEVPIAPRYRTTEPLEAEFKLGTGPCGKDVTKLEAWFEGDFLKIQQTTTDGELKSFVYATKDLVGRVVSTYRDEE